MSSHFFTKSVIKTPYTAFIKHKFLIPLKKFHVWIFFSDGHWVFQDCAQNKLICQGKVERDTSKLIDLVKAPRAIDEERIIFANCTTFKLECLNPYTGIIDPSWTGDAPTLETLPQSDRSNDTKIADTFNDLEIEVLMKSKYIGIIERKEIGDGNADYLLTVYQQGAKERVSQVIYNAGQKQINLGKGNEEDTFILWTPYHSGSFQFSYFNITQKEEGLIHIIAKQKIDTTLRNVFPWDTNVTTFFGNADASGVPEQYLYDFNKGTIKIIPMTYYPEGKDTLMSDVIGVNPQRNQVLLTGVVGTLSVVLYNTKTNKLEFLKERTKNCVYAASLDESYFVEYDGVLKRQENSDVPGETIIGIHCILNKKMFMLHLMKHGKTKNGKRILEICSNPYIVRHVFEMLHA